MTQKDDMISRSALIAAYDAAHKGPPGGARKLMEEAPAVDATPTVSHWISVKDRLPDTYKAVITYDKYSGVKENWLLAAKPCVSWSQGFHVTHWMPLPEPPKEG